MNATVSIEIRLHKRWTYWPALWCTWLWVRLRLPVPWRLWSWLIRKTVRVEFVK